MATRHPSRDAQRRRGQGAADDAAGRKATADYIAGMAAEMAAMAALARMDMVASLLRLTKTACRKDC